jgi:hypothetical protein
VEGVFVEELEDAFADPEFTGLFLAYVAVVLCVGCVGYGSQGVELAEDVGVVYGQIVFLFGGAALFGCDMVGYLGESLRGIRDVRGGFRGIVVGHDGRGREGIGVRRQ